MGGHRTACGPVRVTWTGCSGFCPGWMTGASEPRARIRRESAACRWRDWKWRITCCWPWTDREPSLPNRAQDATSCSLVASQGMNISGPAQVLTQDHRTVSGRNTVDRGLDSCRLGGSIRTHRGLPVPQTSPQRVPSSHECHRLSRPRHPGACG